MGGKERKRKGERLRMRIGNEGEGERRRWRLRMGMGDRRGGRKRESKGGKAASRLSLGIRKKSRGIGE